MYLYVYVCMYLCMYTCIYVYVSIEFENTHFKRWKALQYRSLHYKYIYLSMFVQVEPNQ